MSQFYLLEARAGSTQWRSPYDKNHGFVIKATSEEEARKVASTNASDEGKEAWLNPNSSTCEELKTTGKPGVILTDYHAG